MRTKPSQKLPRRRRQEPRLAAHHTHLACRLDRTADALLALGDVARAEHLSHRAERLREVTR